MKIKEMKQFAEEAGSWAVSAAALVGENDNNAMVCAQVSIAKSLVVIAAAMVEKQIRAELREELEEMRQERELTPPF